jgi:hypothetical protein
LLQLSLEERSRYVFRFDAVFQDQPEGGWGGGNWGYKYGTSVYLADTGRTPTSHATYSFSLADAELDPDFPRITFYGNGGYADEVVTYFDNFRILDLGASGNGNGGDAPRITGATFNSAANQLTLTWSATAGSSYRILSSTDLSDWNTVVVSDHPATGATASYTIDLAGAPSARFFRVVRQ